MRRAILGLVLVALAGCGDDGSDPNDPDPGPGGLGSRRNPAPIGTTLGATPDTGFHAQITLLSVVRGEPALQEILAASSANDPPPAGQEYVICRWRFHLDRSPTPDAAWRLSWLQWESVSNNRTMETAIVIRLEPDLSTELYAGGTHEGRDAWLVEAGDPRPLIAYGRQFDGSGGAWWKLYPE